MSFAISCHDLEKVGQHLTQLEKELQCAIWSVSSPSSPSFSLLSPLLTEIQTTVSARSLIHTRCPAATSSAGLSPTHLSLHLSSSLSFAGPLTREPDDVQKGLHRSKPAPQTRVPAVQVPRVSTRRGEKQDVRADHRLLRGTPAGLFQHPECVPCKNPSCLEATTLTLKPAMTMVVEF